MKSCQRVRYRISHVIALLSDNVAGGWHDEDDEQHEEEEKTEDDSGGDLNWGQSVSFQQVRQTRDRM